MVKTLDKCDCPATNEKTTAHKQAVDVKQLSEEGMVSSESGQHFLVPVSITMVIWKQLSILNMIDHAHSTFQCNVLVSF